jgi:hypothetical protein
MLINRTAVLALGLIVWATAAKAQAPPVSHTKRMSMIAESLDITLGGVACRQVEKVWVVMNGDENAAFVADPPIADGKCHWTATHGSFDTELTWFSLRLGSARTVCAYSKADRQKRSGKLMFECCRTGGHDVEVSTSSAGEETLFSYTREVLENADGKDTPGCTELYSFAGLRSVPISSVWFSREALPADESPTETSTKALPPAEIVRLQLGFKKANAKQPGLIINDQSVTKHLSHGAGTLSVSDMREAFRSQCSRGLCSMSLSLSADGILAELEQRGLKGLKIVVEK